MTVWSLGLLSDNERDFMLKITRIHMRVPDELMIVFMALQMVSCKSERSSIELESTA